jgi:glycosyltransferase involved in cell wall biosynthesis
MNFLYTLTAYPPSVGGAQLHHHQLARQMKEQHKVSVVSHWDSNRTDWLLGTTLFAPSQDYHYEIDGIPVLRLGLTIKEKISLIPPTVLYYFARDFCIPAITSKLRSHISPVAQGSDLIHNVRIGREPLSYASLEIARQQNIPFIFTPVHHPRWSGFRNRAYLKLSHRADGIIALTEAEKEILVQEGISPEKIFVTGIGPLLADHADPQGFRNKHEIDGPIVLFLGQHYRYKGFLEVLTSAKLLWEKFPDVHYVFIGPSVGDSEKYFKGDRDRRVHRLGMVDLHEKTDALAASDVLCVPSLQESFGGVYTEAWSFGMPVIGCPIPAVREVIDDEEDGLLVEQDANDIAEKIAYLVSHPDVAAKFGQAGKVKVEARFSWERLAARTEEAYKKVLGQS